MFHLDSTVMMPSTISSAWIPVSIIVFTVRTHGPYAVTKCYLLCADRTCLPTACKWRVAWPLTRESSYCF